MRHAILTRLLIVIAVAVLSIWAIYPPAATIPLGLDLNGGVQLVLQVRTDDALQLETQAAAERVRQRLTDERIPFSGIRATSATEFEIANVVGEATDPGPLAEAEVTFDRVRRGDTHTFRMKPPIVDRIRGETVEQAMRTIERRVNELGVVEAMVARYLADDQILVQLPGVTEVDHAKQIIKSTAQLRLTLVENGPFRSRDAALQAYDQSLPEDLELLPGPQEGSSGPTPFYVVLKVPIVSGNDLRDARQSVDEFNRPAVAFTLKPEAGARFGVFTERHVDRLLATVLDGKVTSVATILSRIDDQGSIVGLTRDEMLEQVITFKSGALPAGLDYVEEHTVGASLGEAAIRSGVLASAGGLAFVVLFMLGYYRWTGLNALMSIALNLLVLLGLVALVPITMTLPGIAGLILTIGMGVDSNVLIFERIKEELARSRSARAAVTAAFDRVWITIVDTHVTSLIAAALLFQFGTNPIRGFATTLTIGLLANVFTAVFASRTLFEVALWRRAAAGQPLSISWTARPATSKPLNLARWRWPAVALSLAVIGAGTVAIATRGIPMGIDFSGGTAVVVEFERPAVTEDDVRSAVATLPGDEVVQRYGTADDRQFLIRLPLSAQQSQSLEAGASLVTQALAAAQLAPFHVVDRQLVSASIGESLQQRGVYATASSIAAIAIYIAVRFRPMFALGGIVATLHDVLVTVACLALAGYDLSLNVTAALLTMIGYSVNDTIVIFDRVRENARLMPAASLLDVVNLSVTQTLSRTLITAGTTLLSVLSLYLFGGEALRGFAFTMLVGIVSGTYSTVFIASAIATLKPRAARTARLGVSRGTRTLDERSRA